MGLISNASFNSSSKSCPFNFIHGDVRSICVSANGQNYPNAPNDLDFTAGSYIRAFHDLHENVGYAFFNESMTSDRKMFKTGHALYVFNLTTAQEDGNSFHLIRKGPSVVQLRFSTPVPAGGYILVVAGEHERLIMLDAARNVNTDLSI